MSYYSSLICLGCIDGMWNSLYTQTPFFSSTFLWPTYATAQRRGVCQSTHPPLQPTTWQRTSPLQSSSRRRAEGHAASGWGLRLYPSGESARGWALHQTWWARQLGSGTSTGGCEQRSKLGKTGAIKEKNTKRKKKQQKQTSGPPLRTSMHRSTAHV